MTTQVEAIDLRPAEEIVGETVHLLIRRAGMTQRQVAKQIGMQEGTLGKKIKSQRGWELWELQSVASVLGVEVTALFSGVPARVSARPERFELPTF